MWVSGLRSTQTRFQMQCGGPAAIANKAGNGVCKIFTRFLPRTEDDELRELVVDGRAWGYLSARSQLAKDLDLYEKCLLMTG